MDAAKCIENGLGVLGIEFGSTRIKAVLTDEDFRPIANGAHSWENRLENGVWTYSLDDIWNGLQDCYSKLASDVKEKYGTELTTVGAIGFSAMMHGYMVFNDKDELMVPFRTWRNTITGEASEKLTKLFKFHIPQRWSVAHLYQSILEGMDHVKDIRYLSTLAAIEQYINRDDDFVMLLHDAARPFVSQQIISDVAIACKDQKAVAVGIPSTDTIWQVNPFNSTIQRIPERSQMWRAQTPQAFHFHVIRDAYQRALQDPQFRATDDCGVVARYMPEVHIHIVKGSEENKKITFSSDL